MKEKDIWLSPEELQHMLRGSLQWSDVASHVNTSKTGIRKLHETNVKEQLTPKQTIPIGIDQLKEKENDSMRLEGQPVIWLLGSVGLLT
ncbi:MAG TPA: hypothetical protein VN456_11535, partial [Desulfosporosinus sp.]|nr:hypothetical protein [Desulfosporosinus sp.]